jgi:molecular chaperone DnaK (HSP70)
MPKVVVTFHIDANGILQVHAKELRTGKEASIEVRPTYGLTEAEVARMVEESFEHAEEDVNARLLIEAQTEADTVMTHVERALAQGAGLVSAEELVGIRAALQALREIRTGQDRDLIRERTIGVNKATERLAEAMMDAALKGALSSRRADEILGSK